MKKHNELRPGNSNAELVTKAQMVPSACHSAVSLDEDAQSGVTFNLSMRSRTLSEVTGFSYGETNRSMSQVDTMDNMSQVSLSNMTNGNMTIKTPEYKDPKGEPERGAHMFHRSASVVEPLRSPMYNTTSVNKKPGTPVFPKQRYHQGHTNHQNAHNTTQPLSQRGSVGYNRYQNNQANLKSPTYAPLSRMAEQNHNMSPEQPMFDHSQQPPYNFNLGTPYDNTLRSAGRRGFSHVQLQTQSHFLVMVQRLFIAADEVGIHPQALYELKMKQYMQAAFSKFVTLWQLEFPYEAASTQRIQNLTMEMPGKYPLDAQSYSFVEFLESYPHLRYVNTLKVISQPLLHSAIYFVASFTRELDIHRCVKTESFVISIGAEDLVTRKAKEAESSDKTWPKSVKKGFMFFVYEASKRCLGVAEILGTAPETELDRMRLCLKWVFVKDIGIGIFRPTASKANKAFDASAVYAAGSAKTFMTDYRWQSECTISSLDNSVGTTAFKRIMDFHAPSSLLLDFKMFDDAEKDGGRMPIFYKKMNPKFQPKKFDAMSHASRDSSLISSHSYKSKRSHKSSASRSTRGSRKSKGKKKFP